jgi:hypothetical protein
VTWAERTAEKARTTTDAFEIRMSASSKQIAPELATWLRFFSPERERYQSDGGFRHRLQDDPDHIHPRNFVEFGVSSQSTRSRLACMVRSCLISVAEA